MIADVVVDLQYGDCGKGKVTHHLLSQENTHTAFDTTAVAMLVTLFFIMEFCL